MIKTHQTKTYNFHSEKIAKNEQNIFSTPTPDSPSNGVGRTKQYWAETDGQVLAVHLVQAVVHGHLLEVVHESVQSRLFRVRHRRQLVDVLEQQPGALLLPVLALLGRRRRRRDVSDVLLRGLESLIDHGHRQRACGERPAALW